MDIVTYALCRKYTDKAISEGIETDLDGKIATEAEVDEMLDTVLGDTSAA